MEIFENVSLENELQLTAQSVKEKDLSGFPTGKKKKKEKTTKP